MKILNSVFLTLVIFSLVFLAACNSQTDSQGTGASPKTDSAGGKLADFLSKGGSYKCEYVIKTDEGTVKQTVYLNGKDMRAEVTNSNEPGTLVIVGKLEGSKQCSSMWTEGVAPTENDPGNSVIKVCQPATKENSLSTEGFGSGGSLSSIDWNAQASCLPYSGTVNTNPPAGYKVDEINIPTEAEMNAAYAGAQQEVPVDTSSDSGTY